MTPRKTTDGTDAVADVPNVAVNIATPRWQCPHCKTEYGTDHDAAQACAAAGPPPPTLEGLPVLVLPGPGTGHARGPHPEFGLTKVGPVKAVTVDGVRQHVRDVVVAKNTRIDAASLAAAARADDGLVIYAPDRAAEPALRLSHREVGLDTYSALTALMVGASRFEQPTSGRDVKVWFSEPCKRSGDRAWLSVPNDEQRHALNMLTAGLLDRIVAIDADELAAKARNHYRPGTYHQRAETPAAMLDKASVVALAKAHGSPNHVWTLRWLNAHLEAVTSWHARALKAWAAGTGGPIPGANPPRVSETLPKNPGKRREAVMAAWGEGLGYHQVLEKILDELATDAPTMPVDGVPDVTATINSTREGH